MKTIKTLSDAVLKSAVVLSSEQMSKVYGKAGCYLRCNQDVTTEEGEDGNGDMIEVSDCSRDTILRICKSLENAVCGGALGC